MATNAPASLKVIQPFLKLAKEYETRDPVVAYWSRFYAVQLGIKHKTKDNVSFLMNLMDELEKSKQSLMQEEAVTNDVVAQAHLENKGVQLFIWADTEDRASRFNKNVIKSFYSASLIFDIITTFGELNDEIMAQRKYAKWKAAYINNCLKKGETPTPGPAGGADDDIQAPSGPATGLPYPEQPPSNMPGLLPSVVYPPGGATSHTAPTSQYQPPTSQYQPPTSQYQPPTSQYQPPTSQYQPPTAQYQPSTSQYPPQPQSYPATNTQPLPAADQGRSKPNTSGVQLEATDYTKAQKYCKYASSALQYEDVPTAIDNLQKALRLLQTGKDDSG